MHDRSIEHTTVPALYDNLDLLYFFCLHSKFEQAGLLLFDYAHLIVTIVYGVRHCLQIKGFCACKLKLDSYGQLCACMLATRTQDN